MVFMVWDHVAAMFFPNNMLLRIPGRIVFPIFAYHIALGVCHTGNLKKYLFRLLAFAIISQPIYYAIFPGYWNVVVTLFYGGLTLSLWESKNAYYKATGAILLFVVGLWSRKLSYGWYGVYMIFLFFQLGKNIWLCTLAMVILQVIYVFHGGVWIQCFSLLAIPIIYKKWGQTVRLPRYFFYVFYPAHLSILFLLQHWIF